MNPLKLLVIICSIMILGIIIVSIYVSDTISYGMPSLEQLENPPQNFATQIISDDGKVLDHFFIQRRVSLPIDSIPDNFIKALIAVEDRKFYDHWGIHLGRIFNSAIKNVFAGRAKEGASTITMQLACNLFFSKTTSLDRKIREAVAAIEIEKNYTKEEILAMYANTVNFGRGAYGIYVASQVYFDKTPKDLTLSECAHLVAMLKAPEKYNGIRNYEAAVRRRNLVLYLMAEEGYISQSQKYEAINEPINLTKNKIKSKKSWIAPHFVEMIRQEITKSNLLEDHDIYRDGLIIYTTLNSKIQQYAEEALQEHLSVFQKVFNKSWSWKNNQKLLDELVLKAIRNSPEYSLATDENKSKVEKRLKRNQAFVDSVKNIASTVQTGLVVIDPSTGAILAMVGASPKFMEENPDSKYSLNHVTQIKRQPGSSFKPFVYASALNEGLDPSSRIECGPYSYKLPTGEVWSPRGSGQCGEGETKTLYQAMVSSINTVAARLITQVTSPINVIQLAKKMGIQTNLVAVPALSLGGGGDVTPLEMTSAYGTFANEGIYVKPYFITRVEDQYGNILYQQKKLNNSNDAVKPRITHEITKMLKGVVDFGTGREVRNYFTNCEAAGKTGTTNDYADAWFVGYTPQLVSGVWVGFDDRRITFTGGYGYAAKAAAPIWGRLMAKVYKDEFLPYKQRKFAITVLDSIEEAEKQSLFMDAQNSGELETIYDVKPKVEPKAKDTVAKSYKFPKLHKLNNDKKPN